MKGLPPVQLYDMENDVEETDNVYKQYPEVVNDLKALLEGYILKGRSTPGAPQENDTGNHWKELEWMK